MLTNFTHRMARRLRWIERRGWRYHRAGALVVGFAEMAAAATMGARWIGRRLVRRPALRSVNIKDLSIEQRRIAR